MEWKTPAQANVRLAETQDEYVTIHVRREIATYTNADGTETYQQLVMVGRLTPSPEDLARLNAGEDLYISIAGNGWPPVLICVGDPNPEISANGEPQSNPGTEPPGPGPS